MRNECETLKFFEEERSPKSDELFTSDVDALDHAKKRSKPR